MKCGESCSTPGAGTFLLIINVYPPPPPLPRPPHLLHLAFKDYEDNNMRVIAKYKVGYIMNLCHKVQVFTCMGSL